MHRVVIGDRVQIQYVRIPVGEEAPVKRPRRVKLEFIAGSSEVSPALSQAVAGMLPGEHKHLKLQPSEAYGEILPKLIRQVPRERFPKEPPLQVGQRVTMSIRSTGKKRRAIIREIQLESVLIDGNHPLAGREILLDIELIAMATMSASEAAGAINDQDEAAAKKSAEQLEA